jgi:hypothetical protein
MAEWESQNPQYTGSPPPPLGRPAQLPPPPPTLLGSIDLTEVGDTLPDDVDKPPPSAAGREPIAFRDLARPGKVTATHHTSDPVLARTYMFGDPVYDVKCPKGGPSDLTSGSSEQGTSEGQDGPAKRWKDPWAGRLVHPELQLSKLGSSVQILLPVFTLKLKKPAATLMEQRDVAVSVDGVLESFQTFVKAAIDYTIDMRRELRTEGALTESGCFQMDWAYSVPLVVVVEFIDTANHIRRTTRRACFVLSVESSIRHRIG